MSKNDLVVTNGTYEITASSHGMTGKDSVAVADGNFYITAGKAAVKSVNDDDLTQEMSRLRAVRLRCRQAATALRR